VINYKEAFQTYMQMLSLVKTLIIHLGEYFKRREL